MSALAKYIDHTFLMPNGDRGAIQKLCREAKKYGFASVCVNPAEVPHAVEMLKKSSVKVCTVIGFPLGQNSIATKTQEALEAMKSGAVELDLVINMRLLKYSPAASQNELSYFIGAVKEANPEIVTKLIIECCYLTKEEKILACKQAKAAGFDFVKTSTGFGTGGATVEDVELMRNVVGKRMGVKAAGGICDRATAEAMIKAGASRIGTSAGVAICEGI